MTPPNDEPLVDISAMSILAQVNRLKARRPRLLVRPVKAKRSLSCYSV